MSQYIIINHGKVEELEKKSAKKKEITNAKQKQFTLKTDTNRRANSTMPVDPIIRENLELNFCKERDVVRKRQNYINFKTTFAEKM